MELLLKSDISNLEVLKEKEKDIIQMGKGIIKSNFYEEWKLGIFQKEC